jgi:hypothetical protein
MMLSILRLLKRWYWKLSSQWNENWQGRRKYSEKTCHSVTCPPQIPHVLTGDRTWAPAVGSQWLPDCLVMLLLCKEFCLLLICANSHLNHVSDIDSNFHFEACVSSVMDLSPATYYACWVAFFLVFRHLADVSNQIPPPPPFLDIYSTTSSHVVSGIVSTCSHSWCSCSVREWTVKWVFVSDSTWIRQRMNTGRRLFNCLLPPFTYIIHLLSILTTCENFKETW